MDGSPDVLSWQLIGAGPASRPPPALSVSCAVGKKQAYIESPALGLMINTKSEYWLSTMHGHEKRPSRVVHVINTSQPRCWENPPTL